MWYIIIYWGHSFLSCILTHNVKLYIFPLFSTESRSPSIQANQFKIQIKEYHLRGSTVYIPKELVYTTLMNKHFLVGYPTAEDPT